jgi:bile acid:Na+ symporter, BASS family
MPSVSAFVASVAVASSAVTTATMPRHACAQIPAQSVRSLPARRTRSYVPTQSPAAAAPLFTPKMTASADVPSPSLAQRAWKLYVAASVIFTNLFPLWTLTVAGIALKKPMLFTWLTTPYFTAALGILMLSMGITLSIEDFKRVLRRFNSVAVGFVGCYVVMPFLAVALATLFKLPPDLAAGTILIGAVNGGQASNLCTYIANGNVALSVMMTTTTTLGAMFMTPLIAKFLIGTVVPVNAVGIAVSTIQVVLLPIALGMILNRYANKAVRAVLPFCPVLGVAATCLLVGSSVAQCAGPILAAGLSLQIPILLLHVLGGVAGYIMQALAGYGEIVRRTTAIETSMKSSAFGFLLASLHFSNYMVRVPSAVSVVWMALVGSTMSVVWRYIPVNATLKFDRSLALRKGPLDKWLKPKAVGKKPEAE